MKRRDLLKMGMTVSGAALFSGLQMNSSGAVSAEDGAAVSDGKKTALSLWQLPNKTRTQMMSYILKTSNGKVIVIDGGMKGDADYLYQMIGEVGGGKYHVDLWLLTHIHCDHAFALANLLERNVSLKIDRACYDFPTLDWIQQHEKSSYKHSEYIVEQLKKLENAGTLLPNAPLVLDGVEIQALNDRDPSITQNAINNSGLVFRFKTPKTTILFLGDLGVESGDRLVKLQKPEMIKADVVQMAHHGQQGVRKEFYDLVRPRICLWPTPDWLWDNNSGQGDGSGPWKTIQNRAWMDDLDVKVHYNYKNGLVKLDFE